MRIAFACREEHSLCSFFLSYDIKWHAGNLGGMSVTEVTASYIVSVTPGTSLAAKGMDRNTKSFPSTLLRLHCLYFCST